MQPLKVTIELKTGMLAPEQPLHLDALLGALRVNRAYAELGEGINPRDYHYDLPLERYTPGEPDDWVFKASAFRLVNRLHQQVWMQTGRVNLEEVARHREEGWLKLRASKPVTAGGPLKTSLYHATQVWCDLVAYCVGDRQAVEGLLAECTQVGGRRGVGMGQVAKITVEPVPADECDWQHRAMPVGTPSLGATHARAISAIRAPYWDRRQHRPALLPLGATGA